MSLQLEVDSLEGLAPELAALYVSVGDRYRLDVDSDSDALHRALKAERELRKSLEKKVKAATPEPSDQLREAQAERDRALASRNTMRASLFDGRVRDAAAASGLHPKAVADAVRAARDTFEINDQLEMVNKSGASLTLGEWLHEARENAPHWFPASSGGGSVQGTRSEGTAPTIKRSRFDSLHPAQKAALLNDGTRIVD